MWPFSFAPMPETSQIPPRTLARMLLAGLLLLTGIVYLPGLHSSLYVDDYYNLAGLSDVDSGGYLKFVFGGIAGPTGRPLSLLSFALQHESWPGNVAAFKSVNLLLHLSNGTLVFLLCRAIARARHLSDGAAAFFCTAATAFWLLHPMHLSTVLYVVQRMTQMSALFVLLGALGWLHGLRLCAGGRLRAGFTCMTAAVTLGSIAAALCKENGMLLAPLLLVLDRTVLRDAAVPPAYRLWRTGFLILPTAALALYLLGHLPAAVDLFDQRPYSMVQKSLTEAVVLVVYLFNLVLPRPSAFGLFHDDFPVSLGLLDPPATLAAVLLVAGLISAGIASRRRAPLVAFGLLWYFTGHAFESTFLNLQIYFEHRNYLPSLGIGVLGAAGLLQIRELSARPALPAGIAIAVLCLLAWISLQNALLWRQPLRLAQEAVRVHPESRWALANLGNRYLSVGRTDDAEHLYVQASGRHPQAVYPRLRHMSIHACVRNEAVPAPLWEELQNLSRSGIPDGFDVLPELDLVLRIMLQGECRGVDPGRLLALVEALIANASFLRERGQLHQVATNLCLLRLDLRCALEHARAALNVYRTADRQVQYVDILLALGRMDEAAAGLTDLRALLNRRPLVELAYRAQLNNLQTRLDALRARRG